MPIESIKNLTSWKPGKLARNTFHASYWNFLRVGLQAGSLIIMARELGAVGYGALAGTIALYVTVAQLCGLGTGIALVRHISNLGDLSIRLAATHRAYFVTGIVLFALIWPLSIWMLGGTLQPQTLAIIAIAEVILTPALLPAAYRYQAEERLFLSGAILTIAPSARFIAVLCTLFFQLKDVSSFAKLYLGWLTIFVVYTLYATLPKKDYEKKQIKLIALLKEGFPYVISGAAVTAGGELDKTILLRYSGGMITGQYSAAYRIMQAATLPINSLILAVTPRLFRDASNNNFKSKGKNLLLATLTYSVSTAGIIFFCSPLLPYLLGKDFAHSITFLRWMCLLLITTCIRQMLTAQLTAFDMQSVRNLVEGTCVAATLVASLIVIPFFGPFGALCVALCSDVLSAGYIFQRLYGAKWNLA